VILQGRKRGARKGRGWERRTERRWRCVE